MRFVFRLLFCFGVVFSPLIAGETSVEFQRNIDFNHDWKFLRCDRVEDSIDAFMEPSFVDSAWETVLLPHTPRIEPLVVNDQWQGLCWYRKQFTVDPKFQGRKIFIEFEGAMQIADVWLNGQYLITHLGGYLPFTLDISNAVFFDQKNVLAVRLDNRDNPDVPPGKPLRELDFCMYGGLYRNVKLHITDPLHITDAVSAGKEAGGGVFVRYEAVSEKQATLLIQTHVVNSSEKSQTFEVVSELVDPAGKTVGVLRSDKQVLDPGSDRHIFQTLILENPKLWSPDHPDLYMLKSRIVGGKTIRDEVSTRIGIRTISFSASEGFLINGKRMFLRGTNRHQEYPYIGYALSDNAQKRDAIKIKQAGFDYVRLSHYPHSPSFMDACDELGLVVMDAIPGWQFMGNDAFKALCYQNCRELIRRDRNHPSVVLWEVSLNETEMDATFLSTTHAIAHAEYPGDQCFTCGWVDQVYDVYIQARQHGGCHGYQNGDKACLVSEYGDWEYYAQNAGLDQPGFTDLQPEERNSRQFRGDGEKRLLQQAMNFQEAQNDNLSTPAVGDGLWVMFDYNRGYDSTIEASGIRDIFRLPKFSYCFYQSQRKTEGLGVLHVASYWDENSSPNVRVYSNCDRVKLSLNGKKIAIQSPDQDAFSNRLASPPFTFRLENFEAGTLEAVGFLDGKEVAFQKVITPEIPAKIQVTAGLDGIFPQSNQKDVFFVYASLMDGNGTLTLNVDDPIQFEIDGPGKLIGQNPISAEAGIAAILVETTGVKGTIHVTASGGGLSPGAVDVVIE